MDYNTIQLHGEVREVKVVKRLSLELIGKGEIVPVVAIHVYLNDVTPRYKIYVGIVEEIFCTSFCKSSKVAL